MRDPDSTAAALKTTLIGAGWLVEVTVIHTNWGPRLTFPTGLSLGQAEELILTIEAGLKKRVINR
ncbi:hypothetical protein ACFY5K_25545 [Streptomyces griseofuscus]|uniref:hypothetical protein n=1 Tax=Streptomyces griseofuscus TaxID=146922 RepID=UPI003685476F